MVVDTLCDFVENYAFEDYPSGVSEIDGPIARVRGFYGFSMGGNG